MKPQSTTPQPEAPAPTTKQIKKDVAYAYNELGLTPAFYVANSYGVGYEYCKACETDSPSIEHECLICGQTTAPAPKNIDIICYPEGNIVKVTSDQLKELMEKGLVFYDDEWTEEKPNGQYGFNQENEDEIMKLIGSPAPISREVGGFMLLLNEGQEDEQTISLVDYINAFDEDLEGDFMPVINLRIGETYQYGADAIKRISPIKTAPISREVEGKEYEGKIKNISKQMWYGGTSKAGNPIHSHNEKNAVLFWDENEAVVELTMLNDKYPDCYTLFDNVTKENEQFEEGRRKEWNEPGKYQCGSCEQCFDEPTDNSCPNCGSGNYLEGCIDDSPVSREVEDIICWDCGKPTVGGICNCDPEIMMKDKQIYFNEALSDGRTLAYAYDEKTGEEIVNRYNEHPTLYRENQQQAKDIELLREALQKSMEIIDRLGEEYSTVANKHSSYTRGEYNSLNKALKQTEPKQ